MHRSSRSRGARNTPFILPIRRSLRAQRRFDEALAAYSAYLSAHPFHEESVAAQREVVDSRFEAASDLVQRRRFAEAAKAFEAFLAAHPLDTRGPDVMLRLAHLVREQEDPRGAIEVYRRVVSKHPGSEAGSQAQYEVGHLLETALADPRAALEEYGKVTWGGWAPRAALRKAALERRELTIAAQRVLRTTEKPFLTARTRNLKTLTVKVYRVDPATYFARMHHMGSLDGLDIDLINPDHTFEHPLKEAGDFTPHEARIPLPLQGPGLWVVQAGEEEIWSSVGVLVSDLEVLLKAARGRLFAMTWDTAARKPLPGVDLAISDGSRVVARRATDATGILALDVPELARAERVSVLALHAGSAATAFAAPGEAVTSELTPVGYVYTDRPAYRPGQTVHLKAVLRDVRQGSYAFTAGDELPVSVSFPSGRPLLETQVKLSAHGTVVMDVDLPASAPHGDYGVRIGDARRATPAAAAPAGSGTSPPGRVYSGGFRVASYQMPGMLLKVEPVSAVLSENQPLKGRIRVTHPDGSPLRDIPVQYRIEGQPETATQVSDTKGEVSFDLDTRELDEGSHSLRAWVAAEAVAAEAAFSIAGSGVRPEVRLTRDVVLTGETFTAWLAVKDALAKPLATEVTVEAVRRVVGPGTRAAEAPEPAAEVVEETRKATTDERGEAQVTLALARGGSYVVRVRAADARGRRSTAEAPLAWPRRAPAGSSGSSGSA